MLNMSSSHLKHQSNQNDNHQTKDDVCMVLDEEFLTEERVALVSSAKSHFGKERRGFPDFPLNQRRSAKFRSNFLVDLRMCKFLKGQPPQIPSLEQLHMKAQMFYYFN